MVLALHLKWVYYILMHYRSYLFSIVGWNSWNHFACGINAKLIQETADAIVASGLAAAGYRYG